MSYQITSAIIGLILASTILWLIRRDQMNIRHAAWWLVILLIIMFFGIFPSAIDIIASKLGVNYPPTLFLVLSIGMILIKVLNRDIEQSKLERKIRRLAQKLALLEAEMAEQKSERKVDDEQK
jgi:hypothetical protein